MRVEIVYLTTTTEEHGEHSDGSYEQTQRRKLEKAECEMEELPEVLQSIGEIAADSGGTSDARILYGRVLDEGYEDVLLPQEIHNQAERIEDERERRKWEAEVDAAEAQQMEAEASFTGKAA